MKNINEMVVEYQENRDERIAEDLYNNFKFMARSFRMKYSYLELLETQDYEAAFDISFYKALETFDYLKGVKFITYLHVLVNNEVKSTIRHRIYAFQPNLISSYLYEDIASKGYDRLNLPIDYINEIKNTNESSKYNMEKSLLEKILEKMGDVIRNTKNLEERDKFILYSLILEDKTQTEVALTLGISKPAVSKKYNRIKRDLCNAKKYLNGEKTKKKNNYVKFLEELDEHGILL